jgi:phthiocerol/phenolphthiocerol synthesis type-I polyketide synthase E
MSDNSETLQGIADGIAIVGLAGRFPGAPTVEAFWRNLRSGAGSITFFSAEELAAAGVDPALLAEERYVRAKGTLAGAELFDPAFFGFTPREAELMDPQHRVFLETAWEALEDAGCDPERSPGRIGLFAGSGPSSYLITNLLPGVGRDERLAMVGDLQLLLLNDRDFLATRASYKLNLRGPSVVVQTACSTSLVAVHLACQSLLTGDCDAALAGGVSISTPLAGGYSWQEGGVMSPDGCCRAFDAAAGGSVPGDGCGVVVLKRLVDALADGDTVHAVIRASAVNNDGSGKVGYTAPGVEGQAAVIAESLMMAEVDAASIGYVEAHGSGTTLGDPIEVAALTQAFASAGAAPRSIALGSVKTSIGHCNAAAGIAGLIKTVLALEHGTIPPSLHFASPNPQIDFAAGPFYVPTAAAPWPETGEPRRAGVSSFGMGGTNVHAVLEEAPPEETEEDLSARPWQLLVLSARTPAALDAAAARLADHLEAHPDLSLADAAWTLQTGRRAFEHRRIAVARDTAGAVAVLRALRAGRGARAVSGRRGGAGRPVVFLLPGLGDQYAGMARGLYDGEAVFRTAFDLCADRLAPRLGRDLRAVLFAGERQETGGPDLRALLRRGPASEEGSDLHRTLFAQPLCFAVEYALARLVMSWGIEPAAMIGYSVGEYVAACLSGVLSLEDALDLVARRAQLIAELPGGAMLAVPLPEAEVLPLLGAGAGELSVAATNVPHLTVVAGPATAMDDLERRLAGRGVSTIRLPTTHAFHSAMMRPAAAALTEAARRVAPMGMPEPEPRIPYLSNVTGDWITGPEVADPAYWARHMEGTVRFAEGAARLLAEPDRVFLELGPGGSLGALLRQHPDAPGGLVAVTALPRAGSGSGSDSDIESLLEAAGRLWIAGAEVDWDRLQGIDQGARRRRVRLPAYPFERQRCWIDPPAPGERPAAVGSSTDAAADVADWFWAPSWRQAPLPPTPPRALHWAEEGRPVGPQTTLTGEAEGRAEGPGSLSPGQRPGWSAGLADDTPWLIFLDRCGLGESIAARLRAAGGSVVTVSPGRTFAAEETAFTIDPGRRQDYDELITVLRGAGRLPLRILHLWGVTAEEPADEEAFTLGLVSLMLLGQSLAAAGALPDAGSPPLRLAAVASGLAEVADGDPVHPAKAAVLGVLKVMGQEMPGLAGLAVDVGYVGNVVPDLERLVSQLLAEMEAPVNSDETAIALRGRHRWSRSFAPIRLSAPAAPRLREDGVYLVTDGTHGPGMAIAEHLVRNVVRSAQARVVIVMPPQFPARERWESWEGLPEVPPGQDVIGTAIGRLLALEADGLLDRILLVRSAPTDTAGLRAAFAEARARAGRVRGVFHTAGAFTGGLILLKTREALLAAIDPAVRGARALLAAVKSEPEPPDFILLSSSTLAVAGGLGQIDHAAAGCFLEALALRLAGDWTDGAAATVAVHWDPYQWGGWLAGAAGAAAGLAPEEIAANLKSFGVPPGASGEALERLLAAGLPGCAVSTRDLGVLLRETDELTVQALAGQVGHGPRETHPRPGLSTEYAPPGDELEEKLAVLWQDLFGISPVGVHDSFLELGGHSLLAIQMATQLRSQLAVDLPVTVLFEAPTIAELARRVRQARGEDDPATMDALLALVEGLSPEETAAKLAEMGL